MKSPQNGTDRCFFAPKNGQIRGGGSGCGVSPPPNPRGWSLCSLFHQVLPQIGGRHPPPPLRRKTVKRILGLTKFRGFNPIFPHPPPRDALFRVGFHRGGGPLSGDNSRSADGVGSPQNLHLPPASALDPPPPGNFTPLPHRGGYLG